MNIEAKLPKRCLTCGWIEPAHMQGCIVAIAEENSISYEQGWLQSDSADGGKDPDTDSEMVRILKILDMHVRDVRLKAKLFKVVLEG